MDFELNGFEYRLQKLDARRQFHIMRRLSPMFAELASALKSDTDSEEALAPLANALANMSDADADYCLFGLLASVQRKQNGTFSKVAVENQLMFADITMQAMLQLAFKAFQFNFESFFQSPAQIFSPAQSATLG